MNYFLIYFYIGNKIVKFVKLLREIRFDLSSLMIDILVCLVLTAEGLMTLLNQSCRYLLSYFYFIFLCY